MSENTIRWVAGLSNGETIVEGKGRFNEVKNEPSPWRKLLHYIEESNLEIISLRIVCGDQSFMIPSMKESYKFYDGLLPSRLIHFHYKVFDTSKGSRPMDYICIRAEYDEKGIGLNLYVDIYDTNKCWVEVDDQIGKYDKHIQLDGQQKKKANKITRGNRHENQE